MTGSLWLSIGRCGPAPLCLWSLSGKAGDMKRGCMLLAVCLAFAFLAGGCVAKCPCCAMKGEEDTLCVKCNAVFTTRGEFKCPKTAKMMKAGTYAAADNKFIFPAKAGKCPKCGKPKGTWCAKSGYYSMMPKVTYDAKAKKPVPVKKTEPSK